MIEIKNNFLASKMNKDIDDRLMPKNQHRHAVNLQINRSDNSDAGTVQNILGNKEMKNFRAITNTSDLDCIGVYAEPSTDMLFIFLTNNFDSSGANQYNKLGKNFIYAYNSMQDTATLLVQGAFLNFAKNFPVLGINVLENFLFWTDNRNQPRKINITKALANSSYYTTEEQISVAKPSPLDPPFLYKESLLASTPTKAKFETTMYNVAEPILPTGQTNPYYDVDYIGDAAYLEDKFVRFSYRYRFEDGEYSIIAPFTQIAYIPRQDGYFMYTPPSAPGGEPVKDDETAAYRSTIVSFMQNKVDQVKLQIELPTSANKLTSDLKMASIEILYKDANESAVSVIESIAVNPVVNPVFNTSSTVYEYVYNSTKPFKTLPSRDLIRVNDIVPIKALCQEVISNRIVYSNYQNKASYPKYLDYNVGFGNKSPFINRTSRTSRIEYPNHSVKQNRNYQVGIILADKFGRESGVILSDAVTSVDARQFGASSLYIGYRDASKTAPSNYPGTALKVLFNKKIDNGPAGWPGLYNGNPLSDDYNPLGWYSYKVVVKQTEQDYYNVYFPGFMAAYPTNQTLELGKTSHAVLINDNINKVPRDLTEVGPAQLQFRSSAVLYPRVNNNTLGYKNQQFYPGNTYSLASTIATNNSLFFPDNAMPPNVPAGYDKFYQVNSDPLIARLSTPAQLGVISTNNVINLSVAETKPFDSKLDIYWETSTVGIISELNELIDKGTQGATEMSSETLSLSEGKNNTTPVVVINDMTFYDDIGNVVVLSPEEVELTSVVNLAGDNITSKFTIQETSDEGIFEIIANASSYFTYQSPLTKNQYKFTITSSSGIPNITQDYEVDLTLTNVAPSITSPSPGSSFTFNENTGTQTITTFAGVNGSADPSSNQLGLSWSLVNAPSNFVISSGGVLTVNTNGLAPSNYAITVRLSDPGTSVTIPINVTINEVAALYMLSGGSSGASYTYYDAINTAQYAELGPGVTIARCMLGSSKPPSATYISPCTTVPTGCAIFTLSGGSSGRSFTFTPIGESVTTLNVPANASTTLRIQTPYNTIGALQTTGTVQNIDTCPANADYARSDYSLFDYFT
jgi:hypothetical protein